jgi:hypothetical protein
MATYPTVKNWFFFKQTFSLLQKFYRNQLKWMTCSKIQGNFRTLNSPPPPRLQQQKSFRSVSVLGAKVSRVFFCHFRTPKVGNEALELVTIGLLTSLSFSADILCCYLYLSIVNYVENYKMCLSLVHRIFLFFLLCFAGGFKLSKHETISGCDIHANEFCNIKVRHRLMGHW